ncbi:hypothetical protein Pyn_32047 [Prunus yedoensis var. nudiflora]|uniref:Uncharacterized protein n=1 Tax=Prunus yedoensis var. nudiflora TaxID=2094558 RepID=A0A314YY27_PRUYE|nr:hypothetical protein Pyn_32047 [Prunus yedoensis var. nudiflora]
MAVTWPDMCEIMNSFKQFGYTLGRNNPNVDHEAHPKAVSRLWFYPGPPLTPPPPSAGTSSGTDNMEATNARRL